MKIVRATDVIAKICIADILENADINCDSDVNIIVPVTLYENVSLREDFVTAYADEIFSLSRFEEFRWAFQSWIAIDASKVTIITDTCN